MKAKTRKLKPLPILKTDREAEHFVATADLTEYDLSGGQMVQFEFQSKDANLNLRIPTGLLSALKAKATAQKIPYQRFIRLILERAVR